MKAPAKKQPDIPYLLLRVGLAAVLLYAAIDAFREPEAWLGFVPHFMTRFVAAKTSLDILSGLQIVLAIGLMLGKYIRYTAGLAALLLAGILLLNPNALYETFRDFGLLCMALALVFRDN